MKNKKQKNRKFFENNFFPKNRRGFLLTEETLKIVIAVIGLAILIYFLVTLFYSNVTEKKERDALATIERISKVVDGFDSGQREVNLLQPKGWSLFSFVGEIKKPNSCFGENCLCICEEVWVDAFDNQIKKCASKGSCLILENLEGFETFEIKSYGEGTTDINISKEEGRTRIIEIK